MLSGFLVFIWFAKRHSLAVSSGRIAVQATQSPSLSLLVPQATSILLVYSIPHYSRFLEMYALKRISFLNWNFIFVLYIERAVYCTCVLLWCYINGTQFIWTKGNRPLNQNKKEDALSPLSEESECCGKRAFNIWGIIFKTILISDLSHYFPKYFYIIYLPLVSFP